MKWWQSKLCQMWPTKPWWPAMYISDFLSNIVVLFFLADDADLANIKCYAFPELRKG